MQGREIQSSLVEHMLALRFTRLHFHLGRPSLVLSARCWPSLPLRPTAPAVILALPYLRLALAPRATFLSQPPSPACLSFHPNLAEAIAPTPSWHGTNEVN